MLWYNLKSISFGWWEASVWVSFYGVHGAPHLSTYNNVFTYAPAIFNPLAVSYRQLCDVMHQFPYFFPLLRCSPTRAMSSSFLRFLDHTERHITFGRTPLDKWSALRLNPYLTTQNTHNRQTSIHPVGFETTIWAGERPQTYPLDRAVTGIGHQFPYRKINKKHFQLR